jgi:hypothetical protein
LIPTAFSLEHTVSQSPRIVACPFDEDILKRYLDLSARHYGAQSTSADAAYARWKCMAGPAGSARYIGIRRGDQEVGRLVLQRRDLRYRQQRLRGGISIDLLVDSRKAAPTDAVMLAFALPKAETFDIIYHTNNENSAPLGEKMHRLIPRYVSRFALRPYGLPLRARKALASLVGVDLPGIDLLTAPWRAGLGLVARTTEVEVSESAPSADELSGLLDRFASAVGLHSVRDADVLQWRFAEKPRDRGAVRYLRASGRLVGYYATMVTSFAGAKFLALMDAVVEPALAGSIIPAIKRLALADALGQRCDMLFAMFNPRSAMAAAFTGFPFLPLPDRLMKHRTPIFVLDIDPAFADIAARDDGYFLLTDLDSF